MGYRKGGTFPVLLARDGRRSIRHLGDGCFIKLRLRQRQKGEKYPLADAMLDLFTDPDAVESVYATFNYARRMFGPCVDEWTVDVSSDLNSFPLAINGVRGDSFSLALLFQIVARCNDAEWPDGVFVTGAVRRGRGFRCVSVGQAVAKYRWLELYGYGQFLLPQRNYWQLGRAGFERDRCIALPPNLEECIELWTRCLV